MTMALDKLENKLKIHHLHVMRFYMVKIAKIGPVDPNIFDEICPFFWRRHT